jgi:hypothetical protein
MALTLEDVDRRVTALELAHSAGSENVITRIEREVKALPSIVADMIAESERRTRAEAQRLADRISASERRMIDLLSDRFDAVMIALDRPKSP